MFEVPFFYVLDADMFFEQFKNLFIGSLQACIDLFNFELLLPVVLESQKTSHYYPRECE